MKLYTTEKIKVHKIFLSRSCRDTSAMSVVRRSPLLALVSLQQSICCFDTSAASGHFLTTNKLKLNTLPLLALVLRFRLFRIHIDQLRLSFLSKVYNDANDLKVSTHFNLGLFLLSDYFVL
jgi:hypothetical protein